MDIEKVNSMDFGEFVDVFGNVVERRPLIAAAVRSQRPFSDLEDLEQHFFAFTDALPQSGYKSPSPTDVIPMDRPRPSPLEQSETHSVAFAGSLQALVSGPLRHQSPPESKGL
ncbi:hypothetical protein E2I00_003153 [Balaenoptera physalus]|uniref:2-oxo-4-hydroxy-4-carboxy-5-ureidoimidazoline decarboxylase n=1 Tax=Balaenoptera physalus TaxID=9770 RepID=A0A6A1QHX0_BALPH|nr:hypothetical protein E2I00_003153 [Balaenoptera physalus]